MSKSTYNSNQVLKNTQDQVSLGKSQRAQQSYNTLKTTEATSENVSEEARRGEMYDNLVTSAKQAQQKYEDALKMYQSRIHGEQYKNKNITLTDGTTGFVNNLGYFQKYTDLSSTAGANNCPAQETSISPGISSMDIANPLSKLTSSEPKSPDTYCGYEGKNVFVNTTLSKNPESNYLGCYEMTDSLKPFKITESDSINEMTHDECKYMAASLGKPIFGLQNYNSHTGKSSCVLGDNYTSAISKGKSKSNVQVKQAWSSKDSWTNTTTSDGGDIIWRPLFVYSSKTNMVKLVPPPPSGYVVGNIPINPQADYPNGRHFGGSRWSDTFVVQQTPPQSRSTSDEPQDANKRKQLYIKTNYGDTQMPGGPGYAINPWYMGGNRGVSRPLSAFNVESAIYFFQEKGRNSGINVTNRVKDLFRTRKSFQIDDATLQVNMPYPTSSAKSDGGTYVKRTDYAGGGWGQPLVLPMFPTTPAGNAERGIAFMKTDEGIRKMRDFMLYEVLSGTSFYQHCNRGGWSFAIYAGTEIPNMRYASRLNFTGHPAQAPWGSPTTDLSATSSINVPDGIKVTMYSSINFQGSVGVITGPRYISCLTSIPMNGGGSWNDRIASVKIERTNGKPAYGVSTGTGGESAVVNEPIYYMKFTDSGRIIFTSFVKPVLRWNPSNYSSISKCYMKSSNFPYRELSPRKQCQKIIVLAGIRGKDPVYEQPEAIWKSMAPLLEPGLNFIKFTTENYGKPEVYYRVSLTNAQINQIRNTPKIDWVGRTRGNLLYSGETLSAGDRLSTMDGTITAYLNNSGLVLNIHVQGDSPCVEDTAGNTTARSASSVAIYSIANIGNRNANGKIGYIDYTGGVHEYSTTDVIPDDGFHEDQTYKNVNGLDLPNMPISNVASMADAKKKCLENKNCYGFVYNPTLKLLYLKDRGVLSAIPLISRNTILVRRKIKPDPRKYNKGCQDSGPVDNISSDVWIQMNQSSEMTPDVCDRNRFLNEPFILELRNDWTEKVKKAEEYGASVSNSLSTTLTNRTKQQKEVTQNNKENNLNDNIYMTTLDTKIPTANNTTSSATRSEVTSFEGFTPLAAERNLQYELGTPDQRAKSTTFRNIDSVVEDSKLLVDENYMKMGVWTIAAITTGIISTKLLMRANQ